MHNVLIIFYIAFSIGNLFILPESNYNSGIYFESYVFKIGARHFHN